MPSVNKVILVGNVGRDPEVRTSQDGREFINLSLATSEEWGDKNSGEKKSKTEWHRIVIFSPNLVMIVKKYIKKGSRLYIEGSLHTRKWTDNSGLERYVTEVVLRPYSGSLMMLDSRDPSGSYSGNDGNFYNDSMDNKRDGTESFDREISDDDEVPF